MHSLTGVFWCILALNTQWLGAYTLAAHLHGWYPTTEPALTQKIASLDAQAQTRYAAPTETGIRAIIVPHAGFEYSGAVAAAAYRLLDPTAYSRVIIVVPSHAYPFTGIALTHASAYSVANGTISLDTTAIKKLAHHEPFTYADSAFDVEHALEIQLPLLNHYLKNFKLIPLIIGTVSDSALTDAANDLKPFITPKTLVVISSDFTHYGTRFGYTPFNNFQSRRIKAHDNQALTYIQQTDLTAFNRFIRENNSTICGHRPLALLLELIKQDAFGTVEPRIIAYAQSNPQVTNHTESVSYVAATFTTTPLATLTKEDQLNLFEQRELLSSAKDSLTSLFSTKVPSELLLPFSTPALTEKRGAFVTLKTHDNHLRGCIGNIISQAPLRETIGNLVASAALHDHRFAPVTPEEINKLKLELSILTQPRRIKNLQEIKLGTHGIILHHNGASAVYLPEVATEQKWDLPTTLASLSQKAGLAENAWRDKKTWFEIFESIKIK